jgi:hypothetical protein
VLKGGAQPLLVGDALAAKLIERALVFENGFVLRSDLHVPRRLIVILIL